MKTPTEVSLRFYVRLFLAAESTGGGPYVHRETVVGK
jgi:hypothetical protein